VALDPSWETVSQACEQDFDFLLCHHPLSLKPSLPSTTNHYHHILKALLGKDIWLYSAHTSLDANPGGPVSWLANKLGLKDTKTVLPSYTIPALRVESSPALPGSAQTEIEEKFNPLEIKKDSGDIRELTIWSDRENQFLSFINARFPDSRTISFPLCSPVRKFGLGLCGSLGQELSADSFLQLLNKQMGITVSRFVGDPPEKIKKVAYCPGSGADFASRAFGMGADVYITGDIKYHQAQDIEEHGFALDVGHFILEEEMMRNWCGLLQKQLPELKISFIPGKDPFRAEF
jgi:dinuclear metal center YbgI/SA1388 family protein